ncbi:hypothetical protein PGT21_010988 [Puccinia graminis f. sp. tritici]|uniref:Uncharacterized protein n=1 Tax=Puccinia graminis f. sp. tritici TaxID=56615 RepID=A0A5B0MA77_PUCGR|nr:hypothetical protein PGTUg99_015433 [Puccinia graminis f. sp. tritici]KAA1090696.1 hypothetical protein PGT21_010988 [Puccinia graminis f. sp. tritici]
MISQRAEARSRLLSLAAGMARRLNRPDSPERSLGDFRTPPQTSAYLPIVFFDLQLTRPPSVFRDGKSLDDGVEDRSQYGNMSDRLKGTRFTSHLLRPSPPWPQP